MLLVLDKLHQPLRLLRTFAGATVVIAKNLRAQNYTSVGRVHFSMWKCGIEYSTTGVARPRCFTASSAGESVDSGNRRMARVRDTDTIRISLDRAMSPNR